MYQIANEAQDFQYKCEIYPSVWFGNMEIDEITDQEIANLYQQVFKGKLTAKLVQFFMFSMVSLYIE